MNFILFRGLKFQLDEFTMNLGLNLLDYSVTTGSGPWNRDYYFYTIEQMTGKVRERVYVDLYERLNDNVFVFSDEIEI